MAKVWISFAAAVVFMVLCSTVWGVSEVNEVNEVPGVTAWALAGDGVQEVRIGYAGLLENIELAMGGHHIDAPDGGIEEWPIRGYVLAHALSTEMMASLLKGKLALPSGDLYGGLFAEYTYDREDEFAGGYVVGGLVAWPSSRWQTVVEYESTVWNATDNDYQLIGGLRYRF